MADSLFESLSDDDRTMHRRLAVACFNETWAFMKMDARTVAQDDTMLHLAHASRFHWDLVGDATNLERGEWLCSRVYTVLGRAEPALHHASRCLRICEEHAIGDWDLAFAHEAMARAHALADDRDACEHHLNRAVERCASIADEADEAHTRAELATIVIPSK